MPNRIRELRKSRKMTQAELGKAVGVSTSSIGMYELERREPDTDTLLKLARIFNVSVDYLICAADSSESFNVDSIAKSVANNLMNQPALMFSGECYTQEELDDLSQLIESSVHDALVDRLKQK